MTASTSLSIVDVVTIVAGTAAIVTAIWHAAMYVGKLTVKIDRHEDRLNDHEARLEPIWTEFNRRSYIRRRDDHSLDGGE